MASTTELETELKPKAADNDDVYIDDDKKLSTEFGQRSTGGEAELNATKDHSKDEDYNGKFIDAFDDNKMVTEQIPINVVAEQIGGNPHAEQETVDKSSPSLFQRLTLPGSMFLSKKVKCVNFLKSAHSVLKGSIKVSCKVATFRSDKSLENICENINCGTLVQEKWLTETRHLLHAKEMSIGVFGRHKAGKSTVLNALLHQEILPYAVTNETASLTRIFHDKLRHVSGSNDCVKENCSNCPSWKEVRGCENICNELQKRNTAIRKSGMTTEDMMHNEIFACVPFMSKHSTGNIQVVLMDTPGLAEANELGITDIAEHQLMTCSAYIYVISCTQLEDQIDTETLKAIVKRDPGIFVQKRILIVITRLDEYEVVGTHYDLKSLIVRIKEIVKCQFQSICEVPDDCIIPASPKGALEARKVINTGKKIGKDVKKLLLEFEDKVIQEELNMEDLDKYSQIPLLEKKLDSIVLRSFIFWKYAIVRDCSRYLETAISELKNMEDLHTKSYKDFVAKGNAKVKIKEEFKRKTQASKAEYRHGSLFHSSLESAYDNDIKSHESDIEMMCTGEFQQFEKSIKQKKQLTLGEYCDEYKRFLDDANESLMSKFNHMKFQEVNEVIRKSYYDHGIIDTKLNDVMVKFCETEITNTASKTDGEIRTDDSVTVALRDTHVKDAPLELKDLLARGKLINYSVLDKMIIWVWKTFRNIEDKDPNRRLLDSERDALLEQQRMSLLEECRKYFSTIKTKIVDGYIEEQVKKIEDHLNMLEKQYSDRIIEMNGTILFWRHSADTHKTMADRHKEQAEYLKQIQVHLEPLYTEIAKDILA